MKIKRMFALLLALVMVFALAACSPSEPTPSSNTPVNTGDQPANTGSGESLNYTIKVWVPDAAVDLTKKQIDDFNKTNTYNITFTAEINAMSESESATQELTDVQNGADLYFFAQDQFARLVRGGALMEMPAALAEQIAGENNASVVAAGKSGDTQYAFPLTNDNGYFMYYDKSVIPEEDLDSLEALVADCEKADKYFAFEMETSAWYLASFFFGTGCHSEWVTDDDGNFISISDDFNSDKGLIAVKGMEKLVKSPKFISSSSAAEFSNNAAIVVTGTWAFEDIKNVLGDNLGATDLPSFEVDGTSYHLGSFSGCKLLGIKPQSDADRATALLLLGQYLTSEAAQIERFNELAWGPANTAAAANEAVLANPGLVALNLQNQYAVPQGQIEGSWWDIAKVIGSKVKEAASEADLKAALQEYDDSISAVFNKTDDEKNAWGVIGAICGTNWDTDFPMTADGNLFKSEALELHAGDELKCRQGASWDVNFPADNVVVEADGFYVVVLDPEAGTVTLEEAAAPSWGVIGSICGTNWDTDFPMTDKGDGTFESEALELKAGDELKCRFGGSWDNNFPAENVKVEADGTYIVVLDANAGTVSLKEG